MALLSIAPCLQWWWIDNSLPGGSSRTQGFCVLTLPTSTKGRMAQPGGGRELWQSARPTPVKFAFCLPRVKLAKTFQVSNLETCQFDFSQWKNGMFVHKINFLKKSIFQEGHVLSENPPDWTFPNAFNVNLHLLWRQHTRTAKYGLSKGLMRVCSWNFPHPTACINTPLYLPLKSVHGCEKSMIWMNKIQFEQDQVARSHCKWDAMQRCLLNA